MSEERPLPYFEGPGFVLLSARVAASWARALNGPKISQVLNWEGDPEEIAARAALRTAAKSYEAQVRALQRTSEPPETRFPAGSEPEWIDCATAAELLGVSVRWAQKLAANGMGEKWIGQWRIPLARVLAHCEDRERRRTNAGIGPDWGRQGGLSDLA